MFPIAIGGIISGKSKVLSGEKPSMTKSNLPTRDQVPIQKTWNLKSIFTTIENWEAALQKAETELPNLSAYKGRLGECPQILLEYFSLSEEISILAMKVMVYRYDQP